jgi:hypothetical protein
LILLSERAEIKIGHVHGFSRHVGVVLEDGLPSNEKVLAEQMKDYFCNTQKPKIRSSKDEYFLDDDGEMYTSIGSRTPVGSTQVPGQGYY